MRRLVHRAAVLCTLLACVSPLWLPASLGAEAAPAAKGAAGRTSTQAPATLAAALTQVDTYAAGEYAQDPVGSLTVGVVADGALAWTKSYGFADAEAKTPATDQTLYRIGSITKQFTGLMLVQLAERGKVRLTDTVQKYVPELSRVSNPYPDAPAISLVQLATMTSGLRREPDGSFQEHSVGPVSKWDRIVLDLLPKIGYAHEPGTKYLYSNIGYAILGLALGRAAGQPYTDYVQQHILAPLGMTNTAFEPTAAMGERMALGYDIENGKEPDWRRADREREGRGYRVPNGALITNVRDLAKFVAWELGAGPDTIIKRETQEDIYSRVMIGASNMTGGYGVGFQVSRRGSLVAYGHGGSTTGFLSLALFDRESKTGVIVFRSVTGGKLNPNAVAMRVLEIVSAARKKQTDQEARFR